MKKLNKDIKKSKLNELNEWNNSFKNPGLGPGQAKFSYINSGLAWNEL